MMSGQPKVLSVLFDVVAYLRGNLQGDLRRESMNRNRKVTRNGSLKEEP